MERKERNWNKRKYIRLLIITFSFYGFVFATPSLINMEYFPKVAHVYEVFTIKFYMDECLKSNPQIILNDNEALLLETSNMFVENGNTVIENQYKIKKIGLLKLNHILLNIGEKIIEAPTIELEVQANPLSKDTQFRTRIFEYKEDYNTKTKYLYEHNSRLHFILGKQYFVLIEGLFEKTEHQKISVQYELPNNAFIEKLKTYPEGFQQDETWKPIAIFLWISLKKGTQSLPNFELILDISKSQEYKLMLEKLSVEVLAIEKMDVEKDNIKENFQNRLDEALKEEQKFEQYTSEEIKTARKIKELREKEHSSFFYSDLKKRRVELEKKMNLENSFPVFHYKLFIMSIIIAIIFLNYPICKKAIKKKPFNFYDILSFCIGIFILIYGIKTNDLRKDYIVTDTTTNKIYTSPDINSTLIEDISIGQTVKIIHTSKDWLFVETSKNIKGWLQKRETRNEI